MNQSINNALGMFINAFIVGLVATVLPTIIASIDTINGVFNASWMAILAGLTVNFLTALILGLNEYVRTQKMPLGTKKLSSDRPRGFLPW